MPGPAPEAGRRAGPSPPRLGRTASARFREQYHLDRGRQVIDHRIEERLQERDFSVRRYRKPRFSTLASPELQHQIRNECDLVIEALAD